jgi:hypothetical protein
MPDAFALEQSRRPGGIGHQHHEGDEETDPKKNGADGAAGGEELHDRHAARALFVENEGRAGRNGRRWEHLPQQRRYSLGRRCTPVRRRPRHCFTVCYRRRSVALPRLSDDLFRTARAMTYHTVILAILLRIGRRKRWCSGRPSEGSISNASCRLRRNGRRRPRLRHNEGYPFASSGAVREGAGDRGFAGGGVLHHGRRPSAAPFDTMCMRGTRGSKAAILLV